jgi:diaminopimelate decarboxylase
MITCFPQIDRLILQNLIFLFLKIGDCLITGDIEAYSMATASDFNLVPCAKVLTFAG